MANGANVAATGNDIIFDTGALDLDPGFACSVNPSIRKSLIASVLLDDGSTRTMRLFVQPDDDAEPIGDGTLYTCTFQILTSALPSTYRLLIDNPIAFSPAGTQFSSVTGSDGSITVTLVIPPPNRCAGDCNADGHTAVDEVLTLVNLALKEATGAVCPAGDVDRNSRVTVDDILAAVNAVFDGCPTNPLRFIEFNGDDLTQADAVNSNGANVDVVPSVCQVDEFGNPTSFEVFTQTIINAVFINEQASDILLQHVTIDPGPNSGLSKIEESISANIVGGRCSAAADKPCATDADCTGSSGTPLGTCEHAETTVSSILLFGFGSKNPGRAQPSDLRSATQCQDHIQWNGRLGARFRSDRRVRRHVKQLQQLWVEYSGSCERALRSRITRRAA